MVHPADEAGVIRRAVEKTEFRLPSGGPKGEILPAALVFALVYYVDRIHLVSGFSLVCFQFRGPKNGFFPRHL